MSIFTRAFNRLGGYDSLAERFPGGPEPRGAAVGEPLRPVRRSMRYDWCVTIVVAADGLWLQARPPLQGTQAAIFVPWAEIRAAETTMLYWRRAVRLTCGEPAPAPSPCGSRCGTSPAAVGGGGRRGRAAGPSATPPA